LALSHHLSALEGQITDTGARSYQLRALFISASSTTLTDPTCENARRHHSVEWRLAGVRLP